MGMAIDGQFLPTFGQRYCSAAKRGYHIWQNTPSDAVIARPLGIYPYTQSGVKLAIIQALLVLHLGDVNTYNAWIDSYGLHT